MRFWKRKKTLQKKFKDIELKLLELDGLSRRLDFLENQIKVDEWILFQSYWDNPTNTHKCKEDIGEIKDRETAAKKGFRYIGSAGVTEVWGK